MAFGLPRTLPGNPAAASIISVEMLYLTLPWRKAMKEFFRRSLKLLDIDIARASFRRNVNDYIANRNIDLVLDVGANVGQFATSLREKGYAGQIESFEPVSSVFQALADTARNDPRWNVHNMAL